jgi:small subunit ribosomal protein S1
MVNKHLQNSHKELEGGPPPLDESWWEAVLTEDEAYSPPILQKKPAPVQAPAKPQATRPAPDTPTVNWEEAEALFSEDCVCSLQVTGYNRGGVLVTGQGLQGFVPISHLVDLTGDKVAALPEEWAEPYLGHTLSLKIIECDRERGRVVFSERAALAEAGSRNQLLRHLKPGDCITGTVTNITDFGVFVDLGGVEGLIHVSEISWGRVRHPSDVVRYGQNLRVFVISVDQERSRVALSLKRLYPNPWDTAESRYFPGLVTEAVITSIVPFGVFARLEEGLDGLIHISEIHQHSERANLEDLFYEGQLVKVRVLHVDASNQRLGLSTIIDS